MSGFADGYENDTVLYFADGKDNYSVEITKSLKQIEFMFVADLFSGRLDCLNNGIEVFGRYDLFYIRSSLINDSK